MFYLATFDECLQISSANKNFIHKRAEVDGAKVSIFNYHLASLGDFIAPLGPDSKVQAHELRGITFVHGSKIERYIMLHKFFNVDQTDGYMLNQISHKQVVSTQDKADGSMIRYIPINGKMLAKTKVSFENDQANMANAFYKNDPNLRKFVNSTIEQGLAAIFELVSPMNQIVLQYSSSKLLLLQLRSESTGEYLDIYKHPLVLDAGIELVKNDKIEKLEFYMELKSTVEEIEGWVLRLDDSQMVKIKTKWYLDRHGILMGGLTRENKILTMIYDETLDDAMSLLDAKDERRIYSEKIQKAVAVHLQLTLEQLQEMVTFSGTRKDFAMKNKTHSLFTVAVKHIGESDEEILYKSLKNHYIKKTTSLSSAQEFVAKELKVERITFNVDNDDE